MAEFNRSLLNPIDDPHSPYFLHHSDNHSSVIITPELNTTNYSKWSRSFSLALSIRNKLGFVNGDIPCPAVSDPMYASWCRCNDLIVAWLLRSVSASISSRVFYLKIAAQIWSVLKTRFSKPDVARICHLQQQLCVITQGTKTVDAYFDKLSAVWEELKLFRPLPHCSCGSCNIQCFEKFAMLQEQDCAFKFLNGLNDSFTAVRSQITMMKPFPCLDEVYNLVLSEESQRNYSVSSVEFLGDASAMAFQRNKSFII